MSKKLPPRPGTVTPNGTAPSTTDDEGNRGRENNGSTPTLGQRSLQPLPPHRLLAARSNGSGANTPTAGAMSAGNSRAQTPTASHNGMPPLQDAAEEQRKRQEAQRLREHQEEEERRRQQELQRQRIEEHLRLEELQRQHVEQLRLQRQTEEEEAFEQIRLAQEQQDQERLHHERLQQERQQELQRLNQLQEQRLQQEQAQQQNAQQQQQIWEQERQQEEQRMHQLQSPQRLQQQHHAQQQQNPPQDTAVLAARPPSGLPPPPPGLPSKAQSPGSADSPSKRRLGLKSEQHINTNLETPHTSVPASPLQNFTPVPPAQPPPAVAQNYAGSTRGSLANSRPQTPSSFSARPQVALSLFLSRFF